jgi:hypothetical protein
MPIRILRLYGARILGQANLGRRIRHPRAFAFFKIFRYLRSATGNWKLATGNWKLATGYDVRSAFVGSTSAARRAGK